MNTYHKSQYPNVFYAKCTQKHAKGDIIKVTTKHGKENECEIFNLIFSKDDFHYYSIIRADGTNVQTRAASKAHKYSKWSDGAAEKSNSYFEASKEGRDFLVLAEPIKVGHHSEKRHRALLDRNWARMGNCVKFAEKSEAHDHKAEYWASKTNTINLSMPESVGFYEYKAKEKKEYHADMKAGKIEKSHSFSLTYAKKEANEAQKNFDVAKKLWE